CLAAGVITLRAILDKLSEKQKWAFVARRTLSVLLILGVILFTSLGLKLSHSAVLSIAGLRVTVKIIYDNFLI
ncbi:MAG: hypothetical protein IIX84_03405, partial [Oscillospiraceae bacterium]|nr:hypothetical protein [Oscillospiraceae bacterium]